MKGWLIVNEFLQSKKFKELEEFFILAAQKEQIELSVKTNAQIPILLPKPPAMDRERPDFILFWDKDIKLAKYLESSGYPLFNSSDSIRACDDKAETHLILQQAGIRMPKTLLSPMTYEGIGYTNTSFLKKVIEELGFPMVVKECFGSFGRQVFLIHSKEDLIQKVKISGNKALLFQEYIHTSFAKDIRLQVVGEDVAAAMYRFSDTGDFRANLSNGGQMKAYQPGTEQKKLAVLCCKLLNLDFGGVDILFGKDDTPIVCEVNSNAHFKNIFQCTGVNTAEKIIQYIKNNQRVKHVLKY